MFCFCFFHCFFPVFCAVFDGLVFVEGFCRRLLFHAVSCINVHSFSFLIGVSGRKCILAMW